MSIACKNNSIDIRIFKKILSFNNEKFTEYFKDNYAEKIQRNIDKKNEDIKFIKELYSKGLSLATIFKQTGFDRRTVKKYIKLDNLLTIEDVKRERLNLCTPYTDKINELLLNNIKVKCIFLEIQKLGYEGKYGTLRNYISSLKKNGKLTYKKTLSRKDVLKLLYNPLKDNIAMNRDMLKLVYKKYPLVKSLLELMLEFKGILLKNKNERAFSAWINKAKKLNLDSINTFIKGCYNDMDAIINSIRYQYSNGVVEASVNKIKLVKRIMHGRCKFGLLIAKTLRLEFLR